MGLDGGRELRREIPSGFSADGSQITQLSNLNAWVLSPAFCQVFHTFVESFGEQRRPIIPLLTAMRRSTKPSEEQRALREAWDALTHRVGLLWLHKGFPSFPFDFSLQMHSFCFFFTSFVNTERSWTQVFLLPWTQWPSGC